MEAKIGGNLLAMPQGGSTSQTTSHKRPDKAAASVQSQQEMHTIKHRTRLMSREDRYEIQCKV